METMRKGGNLSSTFIAVTYFFCLAKTSHLAKSLETKVLSTRTMLVVMLGNSGGTGTQNLGFGYKQCAVEKCV